MQEQSVICPYLDLADERCAGRFTMSKLGEAYRFCFGRPQDCPVHALLASLDPRVPGQTRAALAGAG